MTRESDLDIPVPESWALPGQWEWCEFQDVAEVEPNLVQPEDFLDAPHIAPNHIESGSGRLLPFQTIQADGVTSPKHLFRAGHIRVRILSNDTKYLKA